MLGTFLLAGLCCIDPAQAVPHKLNGRLGSICSTVDRYTRYVVTYQISGVCTVDGCRACCYLVCFKITTSYRALTIDDYVTIISDSFSVCMLPPGETKYLRQDGTQFTGLSWYSITLGVVHILYGVCIYLDYST